jgi:hypothetical protein
MQRGSTILLGMHEPRPCTAHSVRHDGHSSRFRPFLAGSGLLPGTARSRSRPVEHHT